MMRILVVFICFISCTNANKSNNYPDKIKDNNLEGLYDKTKWLLYCVNISDRNDTAYLLDDTSNTVKLYDCDLRLTYLDIKGDTIDIGAFFFYNDTLAQIPVEKDFTRFFSVKYIGGEPVSFGASSLYLPNELVMRKDRCERFLDYIKDKKIGNKWLKRQIRTRTK